MTTSPCFGKRNALPAGSTPKGAAPSLSSPPVQHSTVDPAAFFAEAHHQTAKFVNRSVSVPNSLLAAIMAGLVVGCNLAGLDIMGIGQTFRPLTELLAIDQSAAAVLPFMIMLGLIGGGRAAATTLLVAHMGLRRIGQTSHVAYALGGAAAAGTFAGLWFVLLREQPTHGWLIDCAAGGAAGFLYRMFAGIERD